jgi:hypothetical protein
MCLDVEGEICTSAGDWVYDDTNAEAEAEVDNALKVYD